MKHGGKRPGAGRKRERAPTARSVTVRLDAAEAELLAAYEARTGLRGSDAIRALIRACCTLL